MGIIKLDNRAWGDKTDSYHPSIKSERLHFLKNLVVSLKLLSPESNSKLSLKLWYRLNLDWRLVVNHPILNISEVKCEQHFLPSSLIYGCI